MGFWQLIRSWRASPAGPALSTAILSGAIVMVLVSLSAGAEEASETEPASQTQPSQETDAPLDLDAILNAPLADEEYRDTRRCLSSRAFRKTEILDDQHVAFYGTGSRVWINQLRRRCYGLRPDMFLRFQMHDNRLCQLDMFTGMHSSGFGNQDTGSCLLGKFEAIDKDQLALLREAFEKERLSNKNRRSKSEKSPEPDEATEAQ